jgi:hypothetical protein
MPQVSQGAAFEARAPRRPKADNLAHADELVAYGTPNKRSNAMAAAARTLK